MNRDLLEIIAFTLPVLIIFIIIKVFLKASEPLAGKKEKSLRLKRWGSIPVKRKPGRQI
jgi:hypothetical protein